MTELRRIGNARILTPDGVVAGDVEVENGRIAAINPSPTSQPADVGTLDAQGRLLVPGFIDLQLNGGFGLDFTADPATIWEVAMQLPRFGVTAFLPTIITSPPETIAQAQQVLAAGPPAGFRGAQPLGLHVEGPFLNSAKKGAHNPACLRPPDVDMVMNWSPETAVRLVTLAPELPGALDVVRVLVGQGVVVSAGHSLATVAEAEAGIAVGIGYGTHLFNAMPPAHHREPGLAGALLTNTRATIGLIADGVHVHPCWLQLVWAVAAERLNLVTDGMAAMGLGDGRYRLGSHEVTVANGRATLADGTLAGSSITLDASLRLLAETVGVPLAQVVDTVTSIPAQLLGLGAYGRIAPGCVADLVLLTDSGAVAVTVQAGEIVYQKRDR